MSKISFNESWFSSTIYKSESCFYKTRTASPQSVSSATFLTHLAPWQFPVLREVQCFSLPSPCLVCLYFFLSSYPSPYRNSHSKYSQCSFAPQTELHVSFVYNSFLSSLKMKIKHLSHSPYPLTHWPWVNITRDLRPHLFFSSVLHQYLKGESYF